MENNIENRIKELITNLHSDEIDVVKSAIEEIKVIGDTSFTPPLIQLMFECKDASLKKYLYELLCDIKDAASVPFIIQGIEQAENQENLIRILSICWNSSLKFENYLDIFVDLFIKENFEVSFEAYTVIENMELNKQSTIVKNELLKLKKINTLITSEKRTLYDDLLVILE